MHKFLEVLLLAAVVLVSTVKCATSNDAPDPREYLSPYCEKGYVFQVNSSTFELLKLRHVAMMDISCFSYKIISNRLNPSCPEEAPHSFTIRGFDSRLNREVMKPAHLSKVFGGSIDSTAYYLAHHPDVYLEYKQANAAQCPTYLMVSMDGRYTDRARIRDTFPVLIDHTPRVAMKQPIETKLYFRQSHEMTTADLIVPIPEHKKCRDSAATEYALIRSTLKAPVSTGASLEYVWTHVFPAAGGYRICVKIVSDYTWREVTLIQVHGRNPVYFLAPEVWKDGRLVIDHIYELIFVGHELNAVLDTVKVVETKKSCKDGAASIGVHSYPLFPVNAEKVNRVHWNISFHMPGLYRVCYQRAGRQWEEVPYFDSLPSAVANTLSGFNDTTVHSFDLGHTAAPVATSTAVPKCVTGTAPVRPNAPKDTLLLMTLQHDRLPSHFADWLGTYLCIPEQAIYVHSVSRPTPTTVLVTMDIRCLNDDCDSRERMNYLLWASSNALSGLAPIFVTSIQEVPASGLVVRDPANPIQDNTKTKKNYGFVIGIIIGCIVVFLLIGGALWFVLRQRQYNGEVPVSGIVVPRDEFYPSAESETELGVKTV